MEKPRIERNRDEVLHVVMFPWFAFGHINPFIHLSNKLASNGVQISFLSASGNIPRIQNILIPSSNTHIIPLKIPPIEGLPPDHENTSTMPDDSMPELLKLALDQMQPQIKTLLTHLNPHVVFFDFAQYWLPKIASELAIKSVFFSVFSSVSFSYLNLPSWVGRKLKVPTVAELQRPSKGFPNPSILVKMFEAQNLLYIFKSFFGGPPVITRCHLGMKDCDAIAIKSCNEIEGPYIELLRSHYGKPVLSASLALPDPPSGTGGGLLEPDLNTWLAKFPPKSVVFCSFGSESFLNDEQIKELALGLMLTGLPFFLVLNFQDPSRLLDEALPSGFMERVKGRGMVHTGWVAQQQILAHQSVGCYVTHAGYGSLVEALVGDCQLVLLPLKGDQFFNSKLFGIDLKVGVEVNRRDEDGYFGKCDVLEAVRSIMVEVDKEPGKSIRENQVKWREFMMKREVQDKYVCDLVEDLKAMVWKNVN